MPVRLDKLKGNDVVNSKPVLVCLPRITCAERLTSVNLIDLIQQKKGIYTAPQSKPGHPNPRYARAEDIDPERLEGGVDIVPYQARADIDRPRGGVVCYFGEPVHRYVHFGRRRKTGVGRVPAALYLETDEVSEGGREYLSNLRRKVSWPAPRLQAVWESNR